MDGSRARQTRTRRPVVQPRDALCFVPLAAGDVDTLRSFFAELGDEGRRLRFCQGTPVVPESVIRQLAAVDGHDTVAWLVLDGEHVVGEARFVRDRVDRRVAEVAFAVVPTHQRRGIARRLLETLSVLAASRGIRTFTYSVLAENRAAPELLRSFGGRHALVDGLVEGSASVPLTRTPDVDRLAVLTRDSAATLLPLVDRSGARALAGAAA